MAFSGDHERLDRERSFATATNVIRSIGAFTERGIRQRLLREISIRRPEDPVALVGRVLILAYDKPGISPEDVAKSLDWRLSEDAATEILDSLVSVGLIGGVGAYYSPIEYYARQFSGGKVSESRKNFLLGDPSGSRHLLVWPKWLARMLVGKIDPGGERYPHKIGDDPVARNVDAATDDINAALNFLGPPPMSMGLPLPDPAPVGAS